MKTNRINIALSLNRAFKENIKPEDTLFAVFADYRSISVISVNQGPAGLMGETNKDKTCGDNNCCQETTDYCKYEKTGDFGIDYVQGADLCAIVGPVSHTGTGKMSSHK